MQQHFNYLKISFVLKYLSFNAFCFIKSVILRQKIYIATIVHNHCITGLSSAHFSKSNCEKKQLNCVAEGFQRVFCSFKFKCKTFFGLRGDAFDMSYHNFM